MESTRLDMEAIHEVASSGDDVVRQMVNDVLRSRGVGIGIGGDTQSTAKEPWVPAPGRTTRPRSAFTITSAELLKQTQDPNEGGEDQATAVTGRRNRRSSESQVKQQQRRRKKADSNERAKSSDRIEKSRDHDAAAGAGAGDIATVAGDPWMGSLTGYSLQSKDSLVDVAACLNARRQEVLHLWQQNMSNVSVLEDVEKANQLALEAARDVAELREAIQQLQQKPTLTQEDSEVLNKLRHRILTKLAQFEETHAQIQFNLQKLGKSAAEINASATSLLEEEGTTRTMQSQSRPQARSKNSNANLAKTSRSVQTLLETDEEANQKKSNRKLQAQAPEKSASSIYLATATEIKKNTRVHFSEGEGSAFDDTSQDEYELEQELMNNLKLNPTLAHQRRQPPPTIAKSRSRSLESGRTSEGRSSKHSRSKSSTSTVANEARAYRKPRNSPTRPFDSKKRHEITRAQPSTTYTDTSTSEEDDNNIDERRRRTDEVRGGRHPEPPPKPKATPEETRTAAGADIEYYRSKLQRLHRQLLEQDTKYENLCRDVEKFESRSDFDLMLFKSSVAARLEELESYPELLAVTEKRLAEALQSKYALEVELQSNATELKGAKTEVEKLTKEVQDTKTELSTARDQSERLGQKVEKYRRVKEAYASKINGFQQELNDVRTNAKRIAETGRPYRRSDDDGHFDHAKARIYEDRIAELKQELKKERKHVAALKESRNSLSRRMTHRLKQVMTALEASRTRNRELVKQLRFIQTSYHELFPTVRVPSSETHATASAPPAPPLARASTSKYNLLTTGVTGAAPASAKATVNAIRRNLEEFNLNDLHASYRLEKNQHHGHKHGHHGHEHQSEMIHNDLREPASQFSDIGSSQLSQYSEPSE